MSRNDREVAVECRPSTTMLLTLVMLALLPVCKAHMPTTARSQNRDKPQDLGDVTKNSWAVTGTLEPRQVYHFKFEIDGPTKSDSPNTHKFYLGYYVPGVGQPGFKYYLTVFGMPSTTDCLRWGDGWGRRASLATAPVRSSAIRNVPIARRCCSTPRAWHFQGAADTCAVAAAAATATSCCRPCASTLCCMTHGRLVGRHLACVTRTERS